MDEIDVVIVQAVLESKWPAGSLATGFQLWMKLRNVVTAVAQFRTALGDQRVRRPSLYSSSDDPDYDDEQSVDSILDACAFEASNTDTVAASGHSIIIDSDVPRQNIESSGNRVVRLASKENSAMDRLMVHEDGAAGSELVVSVYSTLDSHWYTL